MPDSPTGSAAPVDLEMVLGRFEASWREGSPPRIDTFLPPGPAAAVRDLLHELVLIDLNYRWRLAGSGMSSKIDWAGGKVPVGSVQARVAQPLVLEDYVRQFPSLGPLDRLAVELIGEEYRVRHLWGDRPGHGSYLTRFQSRAAELPDLLAGVDAELAAERPIPVAVPVMNDKPSHPGVEGTGQFIGPYRVLAWLGQGGTGQVFKVRHERLDRVVALKVIRPELMTDPEVVRRFYREMQLVSKLASPHIVHAFDAGPIGPMHCLVMEYVEGTDLRRLVKQSGPLSPAQAAEYIRQAALGLQHICEHQLVHRDIKPSNLLAVGSAQWGVASKDKRDSSLSPVPCRLPTIKILDLGLARWRPGAPDEKASASEGETSSSSLTPAGALMMGTPDYLAPEQALDFHAADIRADLYSLGCTFYFLLTGQPPFPGGTLAQKLLHHQHTAVPPLAQLRADVPAAYAQVIERLLAKRREDRYQTPAELVAALEALAQGRPAAAARGEMNRGRRHPTRRKITFAVGALLGIPLLAALGFALFRGTAPATQSPQRAAFSPPKSPPTFSFWGDQVRPARPAADDALSVELGVKFRCDVPGCVTAIRFYKSPASTGPHVGHLWDAGGELLASVTFSNETPSGWQSAPLPSPVPIKAKVVYIASYHTTTGKYAADHFYFAGKGVDRGPLHALPDGAAGGNGIFRQGASGFPTETFQALNYWVDVVFQPTFPSSGRGSSSASKANR